VLTNAAHDDKDVGCLEKFVSFHSSNNKQAVSLCSIQRTEVASSAIASV